MPIVVITPTASEQSITQRNYHNFFRVNANDAVQADTLTRFLTQKLNASSVAVLYNDTSYGKGLAQEVKQRLAGQNVKVAVDIQVKEGQSTFTNEIPRVQSAGADAIFYAGYEIETPYLREALVTNGVNVPMVASDGAFLSVTIDEANGTAEGLYVSSFAPSPRSIASATWFEAYQAVESRNPDTYSVNGYVAMHRPAGGFEESQQPGLGENRQCAAGQHFQNHHRRPALPAQRRPGGCQDLDLSGSQQRVQAGGLGKIEING